MHTVSDLAEDLTAHEILTGATHHAAFFRLQIADVEVQAHIAPVVGVPALELRRKGEWSTRTMPMACCMMVAPEKRDPEVFARHQELTAETLSNDERTPLSVSAPPARVVRAAGGFTVPHL